MVPIRWYLGCLKGQLGGAGIGSSNLGPILESNPESLKTETCLTQGPSTCIGDTSAPEVPYRTHLTAEVC